MSYCLRLTRKYAGHSSFSAYRLAWSTAVLDLLAMFLSNGYHGPAFDVKLVGYQFKHAVRTSLDAFAAAIAFASVDYYEVVA